MLPTMKKEIIITKIEAASERLCQADNNLRYIKALQSLRFWLLNLSGNYPDSTEYLSYFYTGAGFSFYERVENSILEYNYGIKPF